jgi:hypothetical protein
MGFGGALMGMHTSGLMALKPIVRKSQVLTGLMPEMLEYIDDHNGYEIYRIPSIKWYGWAGGVLIAWIATLDEGHFIYATAYEEGHIGSTHGDLEAVDFSFQKDNEYGFYIRSPVGDSEYV